MLHSAPNWDALAPDQKEALEMVMHKAARILNGDPGHLDSWHDIGGYVRLVEQRLIGEQGVATAVAVGIGAAGEVGVR